MVQRGDIVQIDFSVGRNNFFTNMKRFVYVLRDGETELPDWVARAFANARIVRRMIRTEIRSGGPGRPKLKQRVAELGSDHVMRRAVAVSGSYRTGNYFPPLKARRYNRTSRHMDD